MLEEEQLILSNFVCNSVAEFCDTDQNSAICFIGLSCDIYYGSFLFCFDTHDNMNNQICTDRNEILKRREEHLLGEYKPGNVRYYIFDYRNQYLSHTRHMEFFQHPGYRIIDIEHWEKYTRTETYDSDEFEDCAMNMCYNVMDELYKSHALKRINSIFPLRLGLEFESNNKGIVITHEIS